MHHLSVSSAWSLMFLGRKKKGTEFNCCNALLSRLKLELKGKKNAYLLWIREDRFGNNGVLNKCCFYIINMES